MDLQAVGRLRCSTFYLAKLVDMATHQVIIMPQNCTVKTADIFLY